jgi:hypothetical protein
MRGHDRSGRCVFINFARNLRTFFRTKLNRDKLGGSNLLKTLVSADGFEPSTHALKEYSARRAGVGKKGQEWRHYSMFMRVTIRLPPFLLPSAHPCYFHPWRRKRGGFVGIFVEPTFLYAVG